MLTAADYTHLPLTGIQIIFYHNGSEINLFLNLLLELVCLSLCPTNFLTDPEVLLHC